MATAYYTIDHDLIDSDLQYFAVRICIESSTGFMDGLGSSDWQNLHATVGGLECYCEVVLWDITNDEAELWVKIPSALAAEDITIKIETGSNNYEREITSSTVIDDFTGDDNDDPNGDLWDKSVSGYDYLSIQDNTLYYDSPGGDANFYSQIQSKFILSGDFDIQLDFVEYALEHPTDGISYLGMLDLRSLGGSTLAGIGAIWRHGDGSRTYYGRQESSNTYLTRAELTGKVRVVRESGVITAYYWKNSQWEWDGNTDGLEIVASNTDDLKIRILFEQENNSEVEGYVDNFTINSCDGTTGYVSETGEVPAQNVWDENFSAVYHMAQDPSGGADCILDSTSNENHGTPGGSMTSGDLVDGGFGKAIDFDGSDDYINCGSDSSLDDITAKTIDIQFNPTGWGGNNSGRLLSKSNASAYGWEIFLNSTYEYIKFVQSTTGDYGNWASPEESIDLSTDYVLSVLYDRSSGGNDPTMWIDGSSVTVTEVVSPVGNIQSDASSNLFIGYRNDDTRHFSGPISEVRISNVFRSDAWIKATYHALNDSLLTYSATDPDAVPPDYTNLKPEMFDSSDVFSIGHLGERYAMTDESTTFEII